MLQLTLAATVGSVWILFGFGMMMCSFDSAGTPHHSCGPSGEAWLAVELVIVANLVCAIRLIDRARPFGVPPQRADRALVAGAILLSVALVVSVGAAMTQLTAT